MIRCTALLALCLLSSFAAADEQSSFPAQFEWGTMKATDTAVELHVDKFPEDRTIVIPRLHSPLKRLGLKSEASDQPPRLRPEVETWRIQLPPSAQDSTIVLMETIGKPQWLRQPFVHQPDAKGVIVLPAHQAVIHGERLRYEPQPEKNTIGYWTNPEDWCEWKLRPAESGTYAVHVLQGCGEGHGGSRVRVQIGEEELSFVVEDTGHFQNFKERNIGTVTLDSANTQSLQIRPLSKAKGAVMDVRQVRLVPVP